MAKEVVCVVVELLEEVPVGEHFLFGELIGWLLVEEVAAGGGQSRRADNGCQG